jgi:SM-20-related protein
MKLVLKQPGAQEIKVKLILAGGQAAMVVLPPEHPLLMQLLTAVASPVQDGGSAVPVVFQIPVEGGRASLTFSSRQLVAVMTDPAVLVQPDAAIAPAAPMSPTAAQGAAPALSPQIIRHPVARLDGFLTNDELDWLRNFVFAAQPRFQSSWIIGDGEDYRKSLVLEAPVDVERLVVDKIRASMHEVMALLELPPFPVGRIECQVTASTDGSYFKVHADSGKSEIDATRELTYVYYFNREPKAFTGGELRVYDDAIRNDKLMRTDSFRAFEPLNNSIVFFNAAIMHEVMHVHVPSQDFRDSRFTVNGWVHRT